MKSRTTVHASRQVGSDVNVYFQCQKLFVLTGYVGHYVFLLLFFLLKCGVVNGSNTQNVRRSSFCVTQSQT